MELLKKTMSDYKKQSIEKGFCLPTIKEISIYSFDEKGKDLDREYRRIIELLCQNFRIGLGNGHGFQCAQNQYFDFHLSVLYEGENISSLYLVRNLYCAGEVEWSNYHFIRKPKDNFVENVCEFLSNIESPLISTVFLGVWMNRDKLLDTCRKKWAKLEKCEYVHFSGYISDTLTQDYIDCIGRMERCYSGNPYEANCFYFKEKQKRYRKLVDPLSFAMATIEKSK